MKFNIGDFVFGNRKSQNYAYTDEQMTKGEVMGYVNQNIFELKIICHIEKYLIGSCFNVKDDCFDLIDDEQKYIIKGV